MIDLNYILFSYINTARKLTLCVCEIGLWPQAGFANKSSSLRASEGRRPDDGHERVGGFPEDRRTAPPRPNRGVAAQKDKVPIGLIFECNV